MQATARIISFLVSCTIATMSAHAQVGFDDHPLQIPEVATTKPRVITPKDLASLRDIDTFSISPDQKFFAINVRRAVLETNTYRTAWFVASASGGRAINVGDAGEPQMLFFAEGRTSGEYRSKPAQWSPDSAWIAYIAKREGALQVWRSRRDGTTQERLSQNPADVRDFMWSSDGTTIYLSVEGRTRQEIQRAEQEEGRHGFLLDERFDPGHLQSKPLLPRNNDLLGLSDSWAIDAQIWVCDIAQRTERRATASDLEEVSRIRQKNALHYKRLADERKLSIPAHTAYAPNQQYVAWLDIAGPNDNAIYPDLKLFAAKSRSGGIPIPCNVEACTGRIREVWWTPDSKEVVFDRAEGVSHASHALYAWSVGEVRVRRIVFTDDLLFGCSNADTRLACLLESPTTPRRLVSVSFADGAIATLFDPNPEFRNIKFGEVERLEWTNEFGHAAFGYFVKPLDYKAGRKYPLVVTTYRSSGFLRGGVGDEYPVHALAANGIGVLSFDKPEVVEYLPPAKDVSVIMRALDRDLIGYRSVLSSLEKGLSIVEASGLVDSSRIGLSGLSYGAETVMFSVMYGHRKFAAAVVSSTSFDPIGFHIVSDTSRSAWTKMGRGLPEGPDGGWWRKVSPALNADRIHLPILMNVSDRELMWSIQTISTLKEYRKPLEVFVYPDEWHVKGWPSHRYAIYQRNLDWFRFWLKDEEDPDRAKAGQYTRWRALRKLQQQNEKNSPAPIPN